MPLGTDAGGDVGPDQIEGWDTLFGGVPPADPGDLQGGFTLEQLMQAVRNVLDERGLTVINVARIVAFAGGDVPSGAVEDIDISNPRLSRSTFYAAGKELLSITFTARGGKAPVSLLALTYRVGFTAPSSMQPPPVDECVGVEPEGDGEGIALRLFVGPARGGEARPVMTLSGGSGASAASGRQYKPWLLATAPESGEESWLPCPLITVL